LNEEQEERLRKAVNVEGYDVVWFDDEGVAHTVFLITDGSGYDEPSMVGLLEPRGGGKYVALYNAEPKAFAIVTRIFR